MVRRRQQNTSQKKPTTGFVRIISGLWRGRKLPVHDAEGLRPTSQAELVTMIELNPQAFQQLQKNVASLKATNIQVVNTDALSFLKQPGTPHHVVFIDPPFRKGLLDETVTLLEQNGWLAEDAMIYIETEKELSIAGLPENWHLHREKTAGQVSYRLYERTSA
ncbi:RsmD family RNA methyltransferase [Vibrio parahaemolyticus]